MPFKEGGGIVFPKGFPGRAYRLNEWQSDRCRACLDRTLLSVETRQHQRVVLFMLIVFLALVVAISFGAPLLNSHPAIAPLLSR